MTKSYILDKLFLAFIIVSLFFMMSNTPLRLFAQENYKLISLSFSGNEYFSDEDVISLHVRRGDYVTNPNHPTQNMDYYENALSYFGNESVIIFSDDPEWCKSQDLFSSDRFSISENNTTEFDLCLMSMCKYHIIANSSFSWWGAWLAKSKKVIAPSNWFGGSCSNKSPKDMYCDGWIVL